MDALCGDDLDAFGGEIDDPLQELAQDMAHRILEDRGSNIDDPARGFDLAGRLSAGVKPSDITAMQYELASEMRKDDRVHDASATITETARGVSEAALEIIVDEGKLGITLVSDGGSVRRVA